MRECCVWSEPRCEHSGWPKSNLHIPIKGSIPVAILDYCTCTGTAPGICLQQFNVLLQLGNLALQLRLLVLESLHLLLDKPQLIVGRLQLVNSILQRALLTRSRAMGWCSCSLCLWLYWGSCRGGPSLCLGLCGGVALRAPSIL